MPLLTIPKKLEGMNKSEKYILNKLKQLYMIEPQISYLYLEPKIKNLTPDFILIDPIRGVIIIEVKAWSMDYIASINEKEVISINGDILENPAFKARRYYNTLLNVFRSYNSLVDIDNRLKINLQSVAILTEISSTEALDFGIDKLLNHYPARVLYKNNLTKLSLDELFDNKIETVDISLLDTIRSAIFPEIKIANISNLNFIEQKILALDVEQERFAKSLPLGHYMIRGIPGSGKTVVLLSRAVYLAKLYPEWKILVLTYNKTLKEQLSLRLKRIQQDLDKLDISIKNIEVKTFHQMAMGLSSLTPDSFRENRDKFWRDILPSDALLGAKPTYDAILVDEYQDFYKHWFELIIKLIIPHYKDNESYINLFLAGDMLQSIYHPKEVNWKQDIGLDMRGRSKLLKTSYRVTQEQISLGLSILIRDKKYKDEVANFYEEGKDILLRNNTKNSIEVLESDYWGVAQKYLSLLDNYKYEDVLVIAPCWSSINTLKRTLPYDVQKNVVSSKDLREKKSLFTTYHSSKGIESKVAIIVDIDKIDDLKLIYVSITRASSKLIIHGENLKNSLIYDNLSKFMDFSSYEKLAS